MAHEDQIWMGWLVVKPRWGRMGAYVIDKVRKVCSFMVLGG